MFYIPFCGHTWIVEEISRWDLRSVTSSLSTWKVSAVGWDLGTLGFGAFTLMPPHHAHFHPHDWQDSSTKDHNSWVCLEEKTWLLHHTTTLVSSCRIQLGFLQRKVIHTPVWEPGCCAGGRQWSRLAAVSHQRELGAKTLLLRYCIHVLFFWK